MAIARLIVLQLGFAWLFVIGCVTAPVPTSQVCSEITQREFAVVRVIDGDTFRVMYDGEETSVRLADYNAPERGEPGGPAATEQLKKAIEGRVVTLTFPGPRKRDHWGRLIAVVIVDGEPLKLTLPEGGRGMP